MLFCKAMICDWLHFEPLCRRIETEVEAGRQVVEPFGIQGWCTSPAILYRAAQTYTATLYPDRGLPRPTTRPADGRLRIGYVSGEFRHQATSILMVELLERHDRSRFELIGFDNGDDDSSDLRHRIVAAFDRLLPISALDDDAAAALVREQGIDVLVNLNGFFGNTRTGLFHLRPAPVQVNYLGFPGTMAAPYMDYLIADPWVIPEDGHAHYSEAIVTLPDCYQPNDTRRRISDEVLTRRDVGLPEKGFVFCCFNNTYKLTPQVFAVWARLLEQVPGSVLWFLGWVPEAALNLAGHCRAHGIDPSRVVAAPFWPQERHLARLRLADLFLDTFPYNAHTTGSDALWAGLPVLTCMGDTFPSRVGASLLAAAGLPELITRSLSEYEASALRLARDPAMLDGLRQRLVANRAQAPLFDMPRLAAHIESAYETMVARARAGQPPAPLRIGVSAPTG
jgi:predicted O-linked N-acetylglucosamine transferase (SPINDLY family)